MSRRILIIQGHPDAHDRHLNHILADAYAAGARDADHEVRTLTVAGLDFQLLRSQQDWEHGEVPPSLKTSQEDILWAEHLVLFFPLWLGGMPALLKGFLEQVARPGFAFQYSEDNPFGIKGLKGRSARVVVTMGMPSIVYRWYFRAHSLKALRLNILDFIGISPTRHTIVGMVSKLSGDDVAGLERKMTTLARSAR
jgi:putative NADPH-quinone reductase